jgi:hypothetical protein
VNGNASNLLPLLQRNLELIALGLAIAAGFCVLYQLPCFILNLLLGFEIGLLLFDDEALHLSQQASFIVD